MNPSYRSLFLFSDVESEEDDVTVLYNVLFALLSILPFSLNCMLISQLDQVRVFHNFGTDETFLEVGMNDTCCLWSLSSSPDCPCSHFVLS